MTRECHVRFCESLGVRFPGATHPQMTGSGPPVRLFSYAPGRSKQLGAHLWVGMRRGAVLMTDGYETYNAIARANELVHLGCWAHCRRYFVEAEAALPKEARGRHPPATQFIHLIGKLYLAESRAGNKPHRRARLRRRYSQAVLTQIKTLLDHHLETTAPKGLLGKALHYLASQWPKLNRYVEHAAWPIDNNPCENAIRPFVTGRNYPRFVIMEGCRI
jgi:transposase